MKNCVAVIITLLMGATGYCQTVTDYDGNVYDVITIGSQKWLKQNLVTSHYQNGDEIPLVTDNAAWTGLTTGAMCFYLNDSATYAPTYGALYNGFVAVDSRNACPTNWHVATDSDWKVLEKFVDATVDTTLVNTWTGGMLGVHLKELMSATWHWNTIQVQHFGQDTYGFTALPAGVRSSIDGTFGGESNYSDWWTSTGVDPTGSYVHFLFAENNGVTRTQRSNENGYSIRCVEDADVGILEHSLPQRELLKVIDLMGRELAPEPNKVLIYIYSDGSIERRFQMAK